MGVPEQKGWKHRRTSTQSYVDIELVDFDDDQLLQGLIDSGRITEEEATAILARSDKSVRIIKSAVTSPEELEWAVDEMRRGNPREAMIHLERFLGHDFIGRFVRP